MKTAKNHHTELINPMEHSEIDFWTKKWGISNNELKNAIMDTGSVETSHLRNYLVKKGVLFSIGKFTHPFRSLFRAFSFK